MEAYWGTVIRVAGTSWTMNSPSIFCAKIVVLSDSIFEPPTETKELLVWGWGVG